MGLWRLSVSIYDARNKTNILEMLSDHDHMDRYNRDLPSGSIAVVGYTVNMWGTAVNVSFNVSRLCSLVFLVSRYSLY
jgi:hypothetical protein